jgi:hypothetical protein
MSTEHERLCNLVRSDGYRDDIDDIDNIKSNIQHYFLFSCRKGHLDIAEWLYSISKTDMNTKININAKDDFAFRWACLNGHKDVAEWLSILDSRYQIRYNEDDMMYPYIRNIKTILLENDVQSIEGYLIESKGLIQSGEDCMVCLGSDSSYWIKLDCNHEVCSDCFVRIDRCPLKCKNEFDIGNISLCSR